MRTIKKEKLKFVRLDDWSRATYSANLTTNDGSKVTWYFKDITLKDEGNLSVNILYCSYDDIEGEPDFPVKVID